MTFIGIKKIWNSIFLKLILILIGAWILISITFGIVHHIQVQPRVIEFMEINLERYARYLIDDMGTPPDVNRAKLIAQKLSLKIRYEGKTQLWSTHPDMPQIKMCPDSIFHRHKNSGISGRIPYLIVKNEKGTFIFVKDTAAGDFEFKEYAFLLLTGITLILACVYFMMRRVLRPIRWLSNGVGEISRGNLEHSIPVLNNDELGRLTSSFNEMSGRILQMLKAKKQLLLDVSHELRSPLTRIKVALEFIPESNAKASIIGDISEIEIMITELLESERLASKHGTIKKTIIPACDIITPIAEQYTAAKPGTNVIIPHKKIMIAADPELISMALKNIIENAIKYSLPDGPPVEITVIEKNLSVIITVTDSGCGIPEDEIPNVFEPFYRVDRSRSKNTGGFGLGLNLAKKIIEAHGGTIAIESAPERGTIVTITLPLNQ